MTVTVGDRLRSWFQSRDGDTKVLAVESVEHHMSDDRSQQVRAQAAILEESARYCHQGQFEMAKQWRAVHLVTGLLAAASSATAAVTTFLSGDLQLVAGLCAGAAAILTAVHTTLKADGAAQACTSAGNRYLAAEGKIRRFRTTDLDFMSAVEAREVLETFADELAVINATATPISAIAYKLAKRNIARGGQDPDEVTKDIGDGARV
ncbi:SLATT domain-containing protein [Granulicoccus sp. GXG6511]|uniref:SLATT domain-containing protein n=1 Tax=Granulicoccus sp. GXG6511 TaxID=3381351 RepID=UPI003D7E5159